MSAIVVTLILLTLIAAKYQTFFKSGAGQMTSEQFYFTTDLLENEAMIPETGAAQGRYQYEDVQEGTWHLYGGGEHEISIHLRNYYDDLRITKDEIDYQASIRVLNENNEPIESLDDLATLEIKGQTVSQPKKEISGTLKPADTDGKAEQELLLKVQSYKDKKYEQGTTIEVNIQSIKPYKKEMKLYFKLYKIDTYLSCEIRDKENSPYAEVIIMTNVVNENTGGGTGGVQPHLQWSKDLSIDNTNSMTFNYNGTTNFTPVSGMEKRDIQISTELQAGESRSIYFFKNDTNKNYSQKPTIIEPKENGQYVIKIGLE